GHLEVTDLAGNGETLTVSEMTGNMRFSVPGRNYSYNYNSITALPLDVSLAGIDSITINTRGGNDILLINSFVQQLPGLTINGGIGNDIISFNGDITFQADADLHIDLQDDAPAPGTDQINVSNNTNLILSGQGNIVMKVSRNIVINPGASLLTVNGNILMEANNQMVPTAENFSGISILNAIIEITGDGQMSINGKAGATTGSNHGIRVESGGDIIAGTSGQMMLEGTGGNSSSGNAHGINVNGAGSTISSHGADVVLSGFGGGTASGDANSGVDVNMSALISAGGSGLVIVQGTGGNSSGSNNNGVRVISGGMITSSGNDVTVTGIGKGTSNANISNGVSILLGGMITAGNMGVVTVNGTGGVGTGTSNNGIHVNGVGSAIQSSGGDVFVTGAGGGTGTSSVNMGISVTGSGKIAPGGMGDLFVEGTGGLVSGSTNYGINISQAGSLITSNGGNVNVLANGGGVDASSFNLGLAVQGATLSAGGTGIVNAEGYGGTSSGGTNHGVYVRNPQSLITSSGGDVIVSGYAGGTGSANIGLVLDNEGVISAGSNGNVFVNGTSSPTGSNLNRGIYLSGLNTMITSEGGNVTVVGQGTGTGAAGSSNGLLLVTQGMITAGGSGTVSVTGTGGGGTGPNNSGISIQNANTTIASSGGNVVVTGLGGGMSTSSSNYGVEMMSGSILTSGANGMLDVIGTGGATSGNANLGVVLTGNNTRITSSGGDINVTGTGGGSGTSGSNYGVYVLNAAKIFPGGNGHAVIQGQGGTASGASNSGVYLTGAGSQITSANGNVTVTGTGGGSMGSAMNAGVLVDASASIGASGIGNTTITGQGGNTTGNSNYGVFVSNGNAMITASQGDINIMGQGGGNGTSGFNFGVNISTQGIVDANGSGKIFISGSGGISSGASNVGIALGGPGASVLSDTGNITMIGEEGGGSSGLGFLMSAGTTVSSVAGGIKVSANTVDIFGNIQASSLDTTQLFPYDAGIRIELSNSANVTGGPLRLSDTKLDMISTGVLTIGHPTCDTILVEIPVTRSTTTDVYLITSGDVIFNPGTINTNGGNLLLDPGPSPMAVKPITSGLEITMDTLSFGSDLAIVINGPLVDVQYHQLHVNGTIDLTGVDLVLSGGYTPLETDSFVIVNNDAMDMIIGTFNGLAEGDTIIDVLGDTLDATITYVGGDGNDVVIRMIQPCLSPSDIVISSSTDTACVGTMITLELASGNLGGATEWQWYSNGCGTNTEGTGTSIMVTPTDTTTYYVRGEGGCVINDECVSKTIVIHPFPDATIYQEFPDTCYYTDRLFRPDSPEIPGATYNWDFGPTAIPTSASGYGPHIVYYTVPGVKNVELVIHPNADGAQCADSSTVAFTIFNCPGQLVGDVMSEAGSPIANVNVRLFADTDTNGIADNNMAIRSVFTTSLGLFAMASLTPGHYVLVQTQPAGWVSFDDQDTSDDGDVVTNSDSLDNIIPLTIVPREEDEDNKYVERPAPGTITGVVFQDFDLDQFPDAGEGLNGITVQLFKDANTNGVADTIVPLATMVTAGNGNYSFPNIPVGHYVLVENQDPGFISIKDFDASNDADVVPNTNMTNDTLPVTLTNGETDAHNYFIDVPSCGIVVTNTLDDGPGSFRQALACAGVGDTIHFLPALSGMTIEIISDPLMLTSDVVVESMLSPQVILSSQIEGLFHIEVNAAVELRGVTVISGLSQGNTGAAFENHGNLTLHNTTIIRNPLFASGEYLIRNHPGAELTFSGECFMERD
ncbi:MAG TPA: SdrD B-like domain-containing protein, partial [Saprospiraceae bacterium]|nr:SdrD B-like domain-containing protein [Saprospiraceae bacterium]